MKKCVCALIALIMSVSVLTACNNGDGVGNESKNQENESAAVSGSVSDESSEASEDGNKPYGWNLPVRDMDNREFRVLCREFGAGSAPFSASTARLYSVPTLMNRPPIWWI